MVLISVRDFQEGKVDIVLKYTPDEARSLKALGEISDNVVINEQADPADADIEFEFDSEDIDDI